MGVVVSVEHRDPVARGMLSAEIASAGDTTVRRRNDPYARLGGGDSSPMTRVLSVDPSSTSTSSPIGKGLSNHGRKRSREPALAVVDRYDERSARHWLRPSGGWLHRNGPTA